MSSLKEYMEYTKGWETKTPKEKLDCLCGFAKELGKSSYTIDEIEAFTKNRSAGRA